MKIGVYNLYWGTFGGGEQHAAGFVEALARDHAVEMLGGTERIDLDEVRGRFGLRLPGVTFRTTDPYDSTATALSADYEVFINHTFGSTASSAAPIGIYSVMFPHRLGVGRRRRIAGTVAPLTARTPRLLGRVARAGSSGRIDGSFALQVPLGASSVEIDITARSPVALRVVVPTVRSTGGSRPHADALVCDVLADGESSVDLALPRDHEGMVTVGVAPTDGSVDRVDGVMLTGVRVDGRRVPAAPNTLRQRLVAVRPRRFLDTYDTIVCNSEYTLRWTRAWWGRGDVAIVPPVQLRPVGTRKEPMILALGRFFDPARGHSKRQLELVEAFRMLLATGAAGWRFVLIGGCNPEDREYAMAVRRVAAGLPIEVRFNAPRAVVDDHLSRASILWHATGFGSHLERHPERAEHFGIAPVEAMSAGVVPVVFGAGGPADVVEDAVCGFHFSTLDELVVRTARLIDRPALLRSMSDAAVTRARQFDEVHFAERVRAMVQQAAEQR